MVVLLSVILPIQKSNYNDNNKYGRCANQSIILDYGKLSKSLGVGRNEILVKEWNESTSFVSLLDTTVGALTPFVIKYKSYWHSIAKKWNYSDDSFTDSWDSLSNVLSLEYQISDSHQPSLFLIVNGDVHSGYLDVPSNNNISIPRFVHDIPLSKILKPKLASTATATRISSKYIFSTNYLGIEQLLGAQSNSRIEWNSLQLDSDIKISDTVTIKQPSPVLLIMQPDTSLQLRYNEYHTVRVQLTGCARYTLFPPHASNSHLFLYPSIHVASTQSQVNLHSIMSAYSDSTSRNIRLYNYTSATLHPGQLLYIPPYWLVHTEAINSLEEGASPTSVSTSVSTVLDVLTASSVQLSLQEAWNMALPFHNNTISNKNDRIISAQVYMLHILSRVKELKSPKEYSSDLYRKRYSQIFSKHSLYFEKNKHFDCLSQKPEYHKQVRSMLDKDLIYTSVRFVIKCIYDKAVSESIRMIWVDNYVEHVARWAMMNNPNDAILFIKECFLFDEKIPYTDSDDVEYVVGPDTMKLNLK